MNQEPKARAMREISIHGDHMLLSAFIKDVKAGYYIDYDGYGYLATEFQMSDKIIRPSHITRKKLKTEFTHVVWFNR